MPKQYGIGRRAPTRAVLSCVASWCLVVRRPRRRVDCLVLTFCYVSSRTLLDMVTAVALSILRDTSHHSWLISLADTTDLRL